MSGGHFDYKQFHIREIIDSIEREVGAQEKQHFAKRDSDNALIFDEFEDDSEVYTAWEPMREDTIAEMKRGLYHLRKAEIYAQRIDWLLSGDDGENDFHERLKEELKKLEQDYGSN